MSNKYELSNQRKGTVINTKSTTQESNCKECIKKVIKLIENEFNIKIIHENQVKLQDIVLLLSELYPEEEFFYYKETSSIKPDGGLLYLLDNDNNKYPILIAEVKNQGTNDDRVLKGLKVQAKGNAIERLGKNVIGLRAFLMNENIFPFVCFGYGDDFKDNSSILDRVVTIAMFGKLNTIYLHNKGLFNRGSFYFREKFWSNKEMEKILYDIAKSSIYYYFSKYGENIFCKKQEMIESVQ